MITTEQSATIDNASLKDMTGGISFGPVFCGTTVPIEHGTATGQAPVSSPSGAYLLQQIYDAESYMQ